MNTFLLLFVRDSLDPEPEWISSRVKSGSRSRFTNTCCSLGDEQKKNKKQTNKTKQKPRIELWWRGPTREEDKKKRKLIERKWKKQGRLWKENKGETKL